MDARLFYNGQTWQEYLESMLTNKALMAREVARCLLPGEERRRWQQAEHVAHVLVFTDDACQDSISALPPLVAIAVVAPFDLRILRRSHHLGLQREISGLTWPPVPMFFFLTAGWQEVGRFVEKPHTFRLLLADPVEAAWLRDSAAYSETWWETEFAELAVIAGDCPA